MTVKYQTVEIFKSSFVWLKSTRVIHELGIQSYEKGLMNV